MQDVGLLHDRLQKIHHSGRLLLGILNDILDFSKIEAGKLAIHPQPFLLQTLFDQLLDLLHQLAAQKGLALHLDLAPDLAQAYRGDLSRLRQVLTNLLGNAIKFTDQGEVHLAVHLARCVKNQAWLTFAVRDTGLGMTPEQQERLFQAFTQADTSISRQYGGTGLGLAISQRLVQAMGGEAIQVQSALGEGACFYFTLPLTQCSAEEEQALLQSQEPGPEQLPRLCGHILLVEDNLINQEVACHQLQQLGLDVTLAENGAEALKALHEAEFDLVLMDIQMPVMDGYQATQAIRAQGRTLPIIALTAAAMIEDRQQALDAGMDGHLSKPLAIEELQPLLARWLPCSESMPSQGISPVALPEEAAQTALPDPVYVDHQAGLRQLQGDFALYHRLLSRFLVQLEQDTADLPQNLAQLATPLDFEQAQQRLHALKGVAGNLALKHLAEQAGVLDQELRARQAPSAQAIQAFHASCEKTRAQLASWLAQSDTQVAELPVVQPTLQQALVQLEQAITHNEFIDLAPLQALARQLSGQSLAEWEAVCDALDHFEFEQAAVHFALLRQFLAASQHAPPRR
ncbi:response regulator [Marinospirillum sp. MEB164]|uniref:histidine kinase n=1 Tax=Marinospirillum alkalitolerans TaxID=3123374 RepID=A0ABW8PU49_9GAMM